MGIKLNKTIVYFWVLCIMEGPAQVKGRAKLRSRKMKPTFRMKSLRDGSTLFHCKQTDVRYIVAAAGRDFAAYRNGELIRTGDRATVVDAVESDANWGLRSYTLGVAR